MFMLQEQETVPVKVQVKDAVILLGGVSHWLYPLSNHRPRAMLTVGNEPLLLPMLKHLASFGIKDIYLPLSVGMQSVAEHFGDGSRFGLKIHYVQEKKYRGTGGCLTLLKDKLNQPFLIVNGNSFSHLDLSPLLDAPRPEKPFFWVGVPEKCKDCSPCAWSPETSNCSTAPAGQEGNTCEVFSIYVAHPSLLSFIPEKKYFNLREQFLPIAASQGFDVKSFALPGRVNPMRTFQDYLDANLELVEQRGQSGHSMTIPLSAKISRKASLHGPVIIGEDAYIGPHAVVIGPAVIGPGSVIKRGAVVQESVLEGGVVVEQDSHVRSSILMKGARVRKTDRWQRTVGFNGVQFPSGHEILLEHAASGRGWGIKTERWMSPLDDRKFYSLMKRVMDLTIVLLAAPFVSVICLILGIMVKLNSKGPMFYRETRLGHNGKPFKLCKLRTMYQDAHLRQDHLRMKNESDGPMFKVINDPRITPLGAWLRGKALDELPQLWNVLTGDMSLVGPRPLADRELKWNPAWRGLRLRVKPGMTGLWQIWCGGVSDFAEWIAMDVHYVQHCSLIMDIRILFRTILVVLSGRRP